MQNLFWKVSGQTRSLIEKPFNSEADLEAYIYDNQDLLGDIDIFYSHVKTGHKHDVYANMLGVDKNHRACHILINNHLVGEEIFPPILMCAEMAEGSIDSFKAIWNESNRIHENIEIDWDNVKIRVIFIAPLFKDIVSSIEFPIRRYQVDLVQLQRYYFEENEFISVEFLEELRYREY